MQTKRIVFWITTGLAVVQFTLVGSLKLLGKDAENFTRWGYGPLLMYLVGAAEVLSAIGLLSKFTRRYSYVVLAVVLLGAFFTHISRSEVTNVVPAVVASVLLAVSWSLSRKITILSA